MICGTSIPFFFEPNFDALVQPLAAVKRLRQTRDAREEAVERPPVVYGDFLKSKVASNFVHGGKSY